MSLEAYSAYDLPSVEALVRYLHTVDGFPVRHTWLRAIKAGNYASWPGLTYQNAAKYCPDADETLRRHMVQTRQGVRSTHPHQRRHRHDPPQPPLAHDNLLTTQSPTNELHIHVEHVSKLYTDDTGRFPVRSRSGNYFIMVAYHCNLNMILTAPFKSRSDKHCMLAYNDIMQRLKARGMLVNLQIMDNKASAEYKRIITLE